MTSPSTVSPATHALPPGRAADAVPPCRSSHADPRPPAAPVRAAPRSRIIAFDYLRSLVTLLVVIHHAAMPYATWATFDPAHPLWSTSPVVDAQRSAAFDLLIRLNDAFFMPLMFFISGLFLYPAVQRHGVLRFLRERALRLGLPFLVGVLALMPLAYYASWVAAGRGPDPVAFYADLAGAGFMVGPNWFLWLLLAFCCAAAPAAGILRRTGAPRLLASAEAHGWALLLCVLGIAWGAYWPLLQRFGPDAWTVLGSAPLAVQGARIALYGAWFLAGALAGRRGLESGVLGSAGPLARRAPAWAAAALGAAALLGVAPALETWTGPRTSAATSAVWIASGTVLLLAALAAARRWMVRPHPLLERLSRRAFAIYVLHYPFVTWIQYAQLPADWPPALKFGLACAGGMLASWWSAGLLLRCPRVARVL